MKEREGLLRKCVGGFYTVETSEGLVICKARGRFRREGISPCAGDRVRVRLEESGAGAIEEILPRKNYLVRPPLANLDRLFIVAAARDPRPDPLALDKTIAAAELRDIEPVVVLSKCDLAPMASLRETYRLAGVPTVETSVETGEGLEELRRLLDAKVSAFTGNSGVGKSSLLNALFPEMGLKTGEISKKLGRGRHTTREVELYKLDERSYVADTPGFSTFDLQRYELTDREQLAYGFREFVPYLGQCRFSTCAHVKESGCAVLEAVRVGRIAQSRHDSYRALYDEIKDWREWQQQKNKSV